MIKCLVSTTETQGRRSNDFCCVPENELVRFGSECDREDIDGSCGCRRSLVGIECQKATTTMKVAELELTEKEFSDKYLQSILNAGWPLDDDGKKAVLTEAEDLLETIKDLPTGSVIERRGNIFRTREYLNI